LSGKARVLKNVGSMSIAVFFSRITGLLRDTVFAYFFGATFVADAFNFAFEIPNMLRKMFGEGALSAAFIPEYKHFEEHKSKQELINFGLNILSILCIFLTLLSLIGVFFAPLLVRIIGPGLDQQTSDLAIKLTRILFPYLFLIGFSSTLISILNAHGYFFIPGLSTMFLNIAMISSVFLYTLFFNDNQQDRIIVFAGGVILGGILQTVVNFPQMAKIGYRFKFHINLSSDAFRLVLKRFIPGVMGLMIREVSIFVDKVMASFLVTGSITALTYGNRLMQLPLGIFGISVSTAVLPLFSEYVARKDWSALQDKFKFSVLSLIIIMMPITAIIAAAGKDIITLLFMRGAFDETALIMTYKALLCYSLGLVFFGITRATVPIFFALKDTKTPVMISVVIVIVNIVLNLILMQFLGHAGLALATSLASGVHFIILYHYLKKKLPGLKLVGVTPEVIKISLASLLIFGFILVTNIMPVSGNYMLLLKLAIQLTVSGVIYYFLIHIMKVSYIGELTSMIRNRFRKKV